jgi:hypothetical protein
LALRNCAEGRIEHPGVVEGDGGRVEIGAVVELDTGSDLEGDGQQIVADRPRFGDPRLGQTVRVEVDQRVVERALDDVEVVERDLARRVELATVLGDGRP